MTDQTQALRDLLEKVERKHPKHNPAMWFMEEVKALGWSISLVTRAYSGSLDAAHSLHSTLLPTSAEMAVYLHNDMNPVIWVCTFYSDARTVAEAEHENPARAWLIAILRAKLAELEADNGT